MLPRARAAAVLAVVLAGCGAIGPAAAPSPTLTPAPVLATPTATGETSTTAPELSSPGPTRINGSTALATPIVYDQFNTYPIGPIAPTCPSGPGGGAQRYPPVIIRNATVEGNWSTDVEAAGLAERAVSRTTLDTASDLAPTDGSYERVRVRGETFDPRQRFDTERFAVVTAPGNPALNGIVVAPESGRTTVHLYLVGAFC